MENAGGDPGGPIAAEIKKFESFGAALRGFFRRIDGTGLFKEQPSKGSDEEVGRLLAEGRYLLRPAKYEFESEACETAVFGLIDLLKDNLPEREEAIRRLRDVFGGGELKAIDFLASVFRNEGNEIVSAMRNHGLEEDLMIFFAVYLARPFRARAARFLTDGLNLDEWLQGYCPVCGHWPALAHIEDNEGHRSLWCMHCDTHWPYKRIQCPYCLNEGQDTLEIITPESETSYRAHVCAECRRYVKEVRSGEGVDKFDFDTVYLATHALDSLARSEGYIQESPLTVRYDDPEGDELLSYSGGEAN